jgi:hypothetical protein
MDGCAQCVFDLQHICGIVFRCSPTIAHTGQIEKPLPELLPLGVPPDAERAEQFAQHG